jgi:hypothetical protein
MHSGGAEIIATYALNGGGGGFSNPMTILGDIIYENATPIAARLAGNTNVLREFLTSYATAGGYLFGKTITIDHTKVGASDSTNFPMLFSGVYPYLASTTYGGGVTNTSGYDIIFSYDSNPAHLCNWEVESYDPTTGTIAVWVQVPTVSHTADTVIYMWYGNSSTVTFQGGATGAAYDTNYQAVWHMNQTPAGAGSELDSTSNAANATPASGHYTLSTSSPFVGGASLSNDGVSGANVISAPATLPGNKPFTISFWVNTSSLNGTNETVIFSKNGYPSTGFGLLDNGSFGPVVVFDTYNGGTNRVSIARSYLNSGAWVYVVGTVDSSNNQILYVNATSRGTGTAGITSDTIHTVAMAGFNGTSGSLFTEARISSTNRSADWITAEYNNQSSPSTFYTLSTATGTASAPVWSALTVTDIPNIPANKITSGVLTLQSTYAGALEGIGMPLILKGEASSAALYQTMVQFHLMSGYPSGGIWSIDIDNDGVLVFRGQQYAFASGVENFGAWAWLDNTAGTSTTISINPGVTKTGGNAIAIANNSGPLHFSVEHVYGNVYSAGALTLGGATPTTSVGQLGLGTTAGFGSGSSATAVTTTTKSSGSGPTTAQTVVNYLEIDLAGTKYWIPLMQ